jgi:hypothetical protein
LSRANYDDDQPVILCSKCFDAKKDNKSLKPRFVGEIEDSYAGTWMVALSGQDGQPMSIRVSTERGCKGGGQWEKPPSGRGAFTLDVLYEKDSVFLVLLGEGRTRRFQRVSDWPAPIPPSRPRRESK